MVKPTGDVGKPVKRRNPHPVTEGAGKFASVKGGDTYHTQEAYQKTR